MLMLENLVEQTTKKEETTTIKNNQQSFVITDFGIQLCLLE
jgi:hypothetical protein